MFYIYVIQNKLNNKLYVGKTSNLSRRWREHKKVAEGGKEKYGKNFRAIHAAIKKYGEDNFSFFDIESWEEELEAYEAEMFWIEYFQSYQKNIGYNETMGGKGAQSGNKNPRFGKPVSDETRQKLSKSRKGKKPSLGTKQSAETKAKWSTQRKGSGNAMYGKHHSDEGKQNISSAKKASDKNRGEKHHLATITNEQALEIRNIFAEGKLIKSEIAKLYNTKWLIIHRIITNQTYKL
jgi:group I intron endonuclease